jgi:hypothetical protein
MRPLKQALYSSRTADKFVVRLPDGMRERIAEVARTHHRSMNSEIIARLERTLLDDDAAEGVDVLPNTHIEELTAKLEVQSWIPQVGQLVRRRDSQDILGTIAGFKMSSMGVMAMIDGFHDDTSEMLEEHRKRVEHISRRIPNQAVGLLEPVDITEVIEKSAGPIHRALERIAAK